MTVEECYQLGYVMKMHGYKGEIVVFLDVDEPGEYGELKSVFVAVNQPNGASQLVPYGISQIRVLNQQKAIVKLEEVHSEEQAAQLKGCALYLPLDHLPELPDDQFYFHEIVGYTVVDQQLGPLGTVSNVYELEHQDLLAMEYQRKEVLIPINDELVLGVDRQARQVEVNLPDGLLDVYLAE
ncbi:MAG: 16S rRNA processing protein RimM [Ferruginibacter sp.]|nr:16S rRNA processing protein RimM [Cytophagales bacterium]